MTTERLRGLWAERRVEILTALSVPVVCAVALVVAVLLVAGLWYVAIALLIAVPGLIVLHRYPLAAVMVWLGLAPFLMAIEGGGAARHVYWGVHRLLPMAALLLVVFGTMAGARRNRLPRLGWPEAMMAGYIVITILSIAYRSLDPLVTAIYMYDHVIIPMALYLLVRLAVPGERELRRLVPFLAFLLVTQALIGALSWTIPGSLPSSWLNREERTTGTLRHPNVYAIVLLFAGMYLSHFGQIVRDRPRIRIVTSWLMVVAVAMAFATLSRAAWLAAVVVTIGLFYIHPQVARRVTATAVLVLFVASMVGALSAGTREVLGDRLYSEASAESALSRLPVMVSSVRMLEQKPIWGWGYDDFNRYNFQFVRSIEGLYVPDKDHSSHNLFLTLLAEQGLVGFALYLGPAAWWLARTPTALKFLGDEGFRSRSLVRLLWLAMAAQVVVYNFSNLRVAFGLGVWWLVLGLLGSLCDWRPAAADRADRRLSSLVSAVREARPIEATEP